MLPPVFYVQQLEQILLRKLLSPPTPAARPLRFLPAPRCAAALMSVFNFFVRFSRVEPCPFGLACLRCAPLSFPAPRARPSRRICAYIHIQFFVLFFCVEPRPLISRVCAARPTHLYQYSVFCQPFPFQVAPLWLRACHIPFSRFSVFPRPVFPPVL